MCRGFIGGMVGRQLLSHHSPLHLFFQKGHALRCLPCNSHTRPCCSMAHASELLKGKGAREGWKREQGGHEQGGNGGV